MSVRVIGGEAKGRILKSPTGQKTRPTSNLVRSAIFSMLEPYLDSARVLDLFSGTGALGVEALSRGADWVDFFENDARQCSAIKQNLKLLDYASFGQVHRAPAERAKAMLDGSYDVILMDPPYGSGAGAVALAKLGRLGWFGPASWISIETSRDEAVQVKDLTVEATRDVGKARLYLLRST